MKTVQYTEMSNTPACVMIADDLTGACDSSVCFAEAGFVTEVALGSPPSAEVSVWNTATRNSSAQSARIQFYKICGTLRHLQPRVFYKKVDSLFRGNEASEIAALKEFLPGHPMVCAPAFPQVGRIVRGGRLIAPGSGVGEVDLVAKLKNHGVMVLDAETPEELREIARQALAASPVPILIGSGGLAREVAALLAKDHTPRVTEIARRGPAVVFQGSTHRVTENQVEHLRANRRVHVMPCSGTNPDEAFDTLQNGLTLVLTVERDATHMEDLKRLLKQLPATRIGGVFASGGDTALLVATALDVKTIRLHREIRPGIPLGEMRGGMWNGMPFVMKSGSFGDAGALSSIVETLENRNA